MNSLCYVLHKLYYMNKQAMVIYNDKIPERLDTYLKEFKFDKSTTIVDGVSILTCPELNNNKENSEHN